MLMKFLFASRAEKPNHRKYEIIRYHEFISNHSGFLISLFRNAEQKNSIKRHTSDLLKHKLNACDPDCGAIHPFLSLRSHTVHSHQFQTHTEYIECASACMIVRMGAVWLRACVRGLDVLE